MRGESSPIHRQIARSRERFSGLGELRCCIDDPKVEKARRGRVAVGQDVSSEHKADHIPRRFTILRCRFRRRRSPIKTPSKGIR